MTEFSLASLVREKRGTISLREAALQIGGVSAATLSRVERGHQPDLQTYRILTHWLGLPSGIDLVLARLAELEERVRQLEAKEELKDLGKVLSWGVRA